MMRVLVIGATSAISERACRIWASRNASLCLMARNQERLAAIASDLRVRGAGKVVTTIFDAEVAASYAGLLKGAWGLWSGFDVVLIAHGALPDPSQSDCDGALTLRQFAVNATSYVNLMTVVADRLEEQRSGILAVISSVAGDRGRASTGAYGAAKAAVTTYCSALRQRLNRCGVRVVTIKPGFVDTPMTASFKKGLLWASPERVAGDIVRAIDAGRPVCYTPWFWRWIMLAVRLIPERVFTGMRF